MNKLKSNEKAAYRLALLEDQDGKCALCEDTIREGQATLDHLHSTGHCRMVLCRACNSAEGKVLHWVKRSGTKCTHTWIKNLVWYWSKDWTDNPLYPTHLNYIEKEIKKLRKIKKKVKKQSTKAKYEAKIQRLQKQLKKEDRDDGRTTRQKTKNKPQKKHKRKM